MTPAGADNRDLLPDQFHAFGLDLAGVRGVAQGQQAFTVVFLHRLDVCITAIVIGQVTAR